MAAIFSISSPVREKSNRSKLSPDVGGIFGAFKGYVIIVILMMFLKMFLPITKVVPDAFSDKNIDSTILFSHMYKSNLIYELCKSINIFIGADT